MGSIGDKQVFPAPTNPLWQGITYRQWLIGKVLEGYLASCDTRGSRPEDLLDPLTGRSSVVRRIVQVADAVIAELDAEGEKDAVPA